ncbi:zinc finger CCHC domain-containing protein 7 isoform X3 [Anguilla rostrata]|uniref:zinc finger CCHC domain-containing protein 7 isoform X3 n=1 Tax=Anguilla rostrata TaxID=7938 RepID=UPI0030CC8CD7
MFADVFFGRSFFKSRLRTSIGVCCLLKACAQPCLRQAVCARRAVRRQKSETGILDYNHSRRSITPHCSSILSLSDDSESPRSETQGPFSMFGGYEEREDYEDELYQETQDSSCSEVESELEFQLYSQVHYSCCPEKHKEEEEEEEQEEGRQRELTEQPPKGVIVIDSDPEIITVSDSSDEEDGVCVAKGTKFQRLPPASRGQPHTHTTSPPAVLSDHSKGSGLDSDSDSDSEGLESWMVLGQGKHDSDKTIQLNLVGGANGSSADEDDDQSWTISRRDLEAQISNEGLGPRRVSNRYYTSKNVTCRSCNKIGHLSKNCPNPRKPPSCTLCSSQTHLKKTCPNRHCSNCSLPGHCHDDCLERAYWHKQCHRCGMTGHFYDACSDIWRQYHLTTKQGPIQTPDVLDAHRSPAYCYNCSRKGHFGFECDQRRMFNGSYPSAPYVSYYDTPPDVRQRDNRARRKAQELQDAGLLQPTEPQHSMWPPGGDRDDGPPRKGMKINNKVVEKKRKNEASAQAKKMKKKKQQQKQKLQQQKQTPKQQKPQQQKPQQQKPQQQKPQQQKPQQQKPQQQKPQQQKPQQQKPQQQKPQQQKPQQQTPKQQKPQKQKPQQQKPQQQQQQKKRRKRTKAETHGEQWSWGEQGVAWAPVRLAYEEDFPRGPKRRPPGAPTPPQKVRHTPGLFGDGKNRKNRQNRRARGRDRKPGERRREDTYADEDLFSIKQRRRR